MHTTNTTNLRKAGNVSIYYFCVAVYSYIRPLLELMYIIMFLS